MNAKAKRNKRQRKLEAKIVQETTTPEVVEVNKVFIYDKLNAHSEQDKVWGEGKNGLPYIVEDYELLAIKNDLVAHKRLGERLTGKLYQLNDDQLQATEDHYKDMKKYVVNETVILFAEG